MTPKEVVQGWHKQWKSDPALANKLYLHPNIKKLLPGCKAKIGWEEVNKSFLRVADGVKRETYHYDPAYDVYICEGNMVAHRFRWNVETKTGAKSEMFVFNLYIVEDEKIIHFEEHFDTFERHKTSDQTLFRAGHDPRDWIIS